MILLLFSRCSEYVIVQNFVDLPSNKCYQRLWIFFIVYINTKRCLTIHNLLLAMSQVFFGLLFSVLKKIFLACFSLLRFLCLRFSPSLLHMKSKGESLEWVIHGTDSILLASWNYRSFPLTRKAGLLDHETNSILVTSWSYRGFLWTQKRRPKRCNPIYSSRNIEAYVICYTLGNMKELESSMIL